MKLLLDTLMIFFGILAAAGLLALGEMDAADDTMLATPATLPATVATGSPR